MRKDVAVLVGVAAVLGAGLLVAGLFYSRAKQATLAQQTAALPVADDPVFVRPHSRVLGPKDAKVTVVEFLDPECESCRAMYPFVKHLLAQYPGKVRLVVRYLPLHGNSVYAATALEAAGDQGKYWEMLETLFMNQPQWGSHHAPKPELIPDYARDLGLDINAWTQSLQNPAHKQKIDQDKADAATLAIRATPTFFVNGKPLPDLGYDQLKSAIDAALAQ